MAELASDLALYLISLGDATSLGVDIFVGYTPDTPHNLTTIYDTGGYPSDLTLDVLKRTVQISVRDTDINTAREQIWQLYTHLDNPESRVVTYNGRKMRLRAVQPPSSLGLDSLNRQTYVLIWR